MWRTLTIHMWSSAGIGSQLGAHEWLMKRASLPPTFASITRSSSSCSRYVCSASSWPSGAVGYRRSPSACEISSPVYSMIRVPAAIGRTAKTPNPWRADLRRRNCDGDASGSAETRTFSMPCRLSRSAWVFGCGLLAGARQRVGWLRTAVEERQVVGEAQWRGRQEQALDRLVHALHERESHLRAHFL